MRGVTVFHGRRDLGAFIRTWPKPLVVVSGDEDRSPSAVTTAAEAATAPQGELRLIERTGHYVGLESPRQLERIVREVVARLR